MAGIDASSLLQMRSMILQQNAALSRAAGVDTAGGGAAAPASGGAPGKADFTTAMRQALDDVSDMQGRAEQVSASYERGQTTDIAAVMLARQQADIGFQATVQVRNKLLEAYKTIMSMPV